jgi:hypothetical protein
LPFLSLFITYTTSIGSNLLSFPFLILSLDSFPKLGCYGVQWWHLLYRFFGFYLMMTDYNDQDLNTIRSFGTDLAQIFF